MAQIKIYTTPTCAYCKMAKKYFQSKGLQYEEYNVQEDHEKGREMFEKTGSGSVPTIEIDDKIIIGFDKSKIDQALGL